ncbi:MAG: hypothetical protein J0L82_08480 [Deltaproteobacteria bacterium]|nr:hypothetical protein [Deltaproteobacteria bacterium]
MSRVVIHDGEPPQDVKAGQKKRRVQQLVSVAVSLLAAIAMASYLKSSNAPIDEETAELNGPVVGDLQSIEGTVQIRPPRSTRFFSATIGPFIAEAMIQTQSSSAAVIEFRPGPTIRLLANSRLVAELDPSLDGVINATLISGDFTVLNPGTSKTFTISQNGVPLKYQDGQIVRTVPLIPIVAGEDFLAAEDSAADVAEKLEADRDAELSTVSQPEAPQPIGTPSDQTERTSATSSAAKDASTDPNSVNAGLIRSTLTNDDIRSQVKSQAGSLQKCYVTMVNRMSETGTPNQTKGELPRGEIRVSFKILSSGKVEEPRVLQSPFKDQTFERCTAEALGRMRFRPFQGPNIPVGDFPIILE